MTITAEQLKELACPQGGYDQLGKSHFCLDCCKHWYGDDVPCAETDCPFLAPETKP